MMERFLIGWVVENGHPHYREEDLPLVIDPEVREMCNN